MSQSNPLAISDAPCLGPRAAACTEHSAIPKIASYLSTMKRRVNRQVEERIKKRKVIKQRDVMEKVLTVNSVQRQSPRAKNTDQGHTVQTISTRKLTIRNMNKEIYQIHVSTSCDRYRHAVLWGASLSESSQKETSCWEYVGQGNIKYMRHCGRRSSQPPFRAYVRRRMVKRHDVRR